MELDIIAFPRPLREMQTHARQVEDAGFGTIWLTEAGRTAYLSCTAAALATERLAIGTGIAVAFARSPMVTAKIAWELADLTGRDRMARVFEEERIRREIEEGAGG